MIRLSCFSLKLRRRHRALSLWFKRKYIHKRENNYLSFIPYGNWFFFNHNVYPEAKQLDSQICEFCLIFFVIFFLSINCLFMGFCRIKKLPVPLKININSLCAYCFLHNKKVWLSYIFFRGDFLIMTKCTWQGHSSCLTCKVCIHFVNG